MIGAAVDAATTLSDHLTLGVSEDEPVFYAAAEGDTDEMRMTVPEDDLVELSPNPAESIFSVDYLADLNRVLPRGSDSDVRLRLGTDEPVELTFDVANGDGTVQYLISPRIRSR